MSLLLDLFITFFKIGAFSFGGGYAMLPLIEKEIIDFSNEKIMGEKNLTFRYWTESAPEIDFDYSTIHSIEGHRIW